MGFRAAKRRAAADLAAQPQSSARGPVQPRLEAEPAPVADVLTGLRTHDGRSRPTIIPRNPTADFFEPTAICWQVIDAKRQFTTHRKERRPRRAHADDGPISGHQGRLPRHARALPHGRLLRAFFRRRPQGPSPARHHADDARAKRRRAGGDGRCAGAFGRELPGQADQARRGGGDRRASRRRGHRQGSGRAQGGAGGHARHDHRQRAARRPGRHLAVRCRQAARGLGTGLAGAVQRPAGSDRMQRKRIGRLAGQAGPGRIAAAPG